VYEVGLGEETDQVLTSRRSCTSTSLKHLGQSANEAKARNLLLPLNGKSVKNLS
jgi:hypothetical protein